MSFGNREEITYHESVKRGEIAGHEHLSALIDNI